LRGSPPHEGRVALPQPPRGRIRDTGGMGSRLRPIELTALANAAVLTPGRAGSETTYPRREILRVHARHSTDPRTELHPERLQHRNHRGIVGRFRHQRDSPAAVALMEVHDLGLDLRHDVLHQLPDSTRAE